MRTRIKATIVTTAMVATFALLPALGASAAEPLEDGAYTLEVDGTTYEVAVVDGVAATDQTTDNVRFEFEYDESGRVLDEFTVVTDSGAYEVDITDGVADVAPAATDEASDAATDGASPDASESPSPEASESATPSDDLDDEDESDDDDDDADDDEASEGRGKIVSAAARCVPNGKVAREAGLPNHGRFVSAIAKGEPVMLDVDGVEVAFPVETLADVEALCAALDAAVDASGADAASEEPSEDGKKDKVKKDKVKKDKVKQDKVKQDDAESESESEKADKVKGKKDKPQKAKNNAKGNSGKGDA